MGVFNKLFGRLRITSDANVSTQTTSIIQTDTTNSSIAIVPNGTGAIIAAIPDGTATGGNVRGNNAVDLQMSRSAANMVATPNYSVIAGGLNNRIGGDDPAPVIGGGINNTITYGIGNTIAGGSTNTINSTGFSQYNTIVGGLSNIANGGFCVVGGRSNVANSAYSTVSGGQSNTASGTHATVVGGSGNSSTSFYAISGGVGNVASNYASTAFGSNNSSSGGRSFVAGGEGCTASGANSITLSGQTLQATATYSAAMGYYTIAYLKNQFALGARFGNFGNQGHCQISTLIASSDQVSLTTGATTTLSIGGDGTLIVPLGNNRSWNVTIKYLAVVTAITGTATGITAGDTKSQNIEIGFKRIGTSVSVVGAGSYSIAQEDASMNTATLVPTAGGSQNLVLTFTAPTFAGGGSITCRVNARIELTEIGWG